MALLSRFWRFMMPQFRCTLVTSNDYERVVEKLRKNISTALLPSSAPPFYGDFEPPRFKVELTGEDERPRTRLRGTLERGQGNTRIDVEAGPGWLGIAIPLFGMGVMAATSVGFGMERINLAAWWLLGTLLVVFVVRYIELRSFWQGVNEILDVFEYLLSTDVSSRSHGKTGVNIENIEQ